MANSTLAALAAATALTGAELVYGVQAGGDVKITAAQIQTFVLGNSFLQFSGPTTTAKTFALPDASATILTTNAAVTVPQGGTGAATLLAHGILLGNGTGAIAALAVGATGTVLAGATGADPAFSATPTLGANGGTGGALTLNGSTSGSVAVQVAAAAGTGTIFQLPATNGTNGWVLQTNGSGVTSWVAAAGGSPGGSSGQIQYNNSSAFGGTNLWVTDANTIEKYNSTTAQTVKVYNTRTDASNYERGIFDWVTTANTLTIGTQAAGTGTVRFINILTQSGPALHIRNDQILFKSGVAGAVKLSYYIPSPSLILSSDSIFSWSSVTDISGTDTGISRIAAATVEVNTGSSAGVGYLRLNAVAVASLPAASVTYKGARGTVSDANATLAAGIGTTVAGGGANIVPVFCNGTNWLIG